MTVFLFAILLTCTVQVRAQEETSESPINIGGDLFSRYVWRGIDFGASPSIQPYIEAVIGNFTIGAWGSYTTNPLGAQEMDLYLNYTIKEIVTVGVIDYFFPTEISGYDYFDYANDSSGHVFEAYATFNGLENLPVEALLGVTLYGAPDPNGDPQNSIYFELGYSFSILDVFLGVGNGAYSTDTNFGLVNLGISASKEIGFTESYGLPVSVSLISNPNAKHIHLVFGISF